jgi:hypothetical protein
MLHEASEAPQTHTNADVVKLVDTLS